MDPFLEAYWGDVHQRLIMYLSDAIQVTLPEDLRARVEERVFVEADLGYSRLIVPDVRVSQDRSGNFQTAKFPGGRTCRGRSVGTCGSRTVCL